MKQKPSCKQLKGNCQHDKCVRTACTMPLKFPKAAIDLSKTTSFLFRRNCGVSAKKKKFSSPAPSEDEIAAEENPDFLPTPAYCFIKHAFLIYQSKGITNKQLRPGYLHTACQTRFIPYEVFSIGERTCKHQQCSHAMRHSMQLLMHSKRKNSLRIRITTTITLYEAEAEALL